MSLRAIELKAYRISCDLCGMQTAEASLMPVEAEIRAANSGWETLPNPLRHKCPTCIEKKGRAA